MMTKRQIVVLAAVLGIAILVSSCADSPPAWPTVSLQPTATAAPTLPEPATPLVVDPLVPTVPANVAATAVITATTLPQTDESATPTSTPATSGGETMEPSDLRSRLGVGVPLEVTQFTFDAEQATMLGFGWYLDWHVDPDPVEGVEFAQMVRVRRLITACHEIAGAGYGDYGELESFLDHAEEIGRASCRERV